MRRARAVLLAAMTAIAAASTPGTARAGDEATPDGAREDLRAALREGGYGFCTSPRRPLGPRQASLCPLADEIEGCDGFAKACELNVPKEEASWLTKLAELLGPFVRVMVWLLVALFVVAIGAPIVIALIRARRDKKQTDRDASKSASVAEPLPPPPVDPLHLEAEEALRLAEEHARRGEHDRAIGLYLAASLSALDRRGTIRLARHRTNGEYVRSCNDDAARQPLREIVREVDRVEYGKLPATPEAVSRVASRAGALVRAAAVAVSALVLLGCGALKGGGPDDPASDELPRDLLRRGGYTVARLEMSLASLPIPDEPGERKEPAPLVVVDTSRVALEDETQAHLLRWVESGGRLVLFGSPRTWPESLGAKVDHATTRDLVVLGGHVRGARVATADALAWPGAQTDATLGDRVYAAHASKGHGLILGVANEDLFTNVGVARPDNAAALLALVRVASGGEREIRIARPEDGVPPPSNPFAALVRAGLAKAAWHALVASAVLFLAYGIRHARARPPMPAARRAFAEHVEATGAFYRRTKSFSLALAAYGRFAEMRLRERLPRGADPATFLASRAARPREEAARVWARATEAQPTDEPRGDELTTIRELRAMLAKALA